MNDQATALELAHEVEQFLYREARLLDDQHLEAWLELFHPDGVYSIPIRDDAAGRGRHVSIVHDDALAREERVYHLLHVQFPAQRPRSRTVHVVSNVEVLDREADGTLVRSSQVVHEVRAGDFRQVGLGQPQQHVGRVEHELVRDLQGKLRIMQKKILLLDRDMPQGNMTFLL